MWRVGAASERIINSEDADARVMQVEPVGDREACQDVSGGRRGDVARPQQTRRRSACYAGGAPDALRMARGGRSRAERARSHPQTPLFLGLKRHGARPNQAGWPAAHWPHYNTWRHLHGASMARAWRENAAQARGNTGLPSPFKGRFLRPALFGHPNGAGSLPPGWSARVPGRNVRGARRAPRSGAGQCCSRRVGSN
jgi:hypothetical protein